MVATSDSVVTQCHSRVHGRQRPPGPTRSSAPSCRRTSSTSWPSAEDPALADPARRTLEHDALQRTRRRLTTVRGARPRASTGAASDKPHRTIYDAEHRETCRARRSAPRATSPPRTPRVNRAYAGLGATFELYLKAYGRHSIDGAGLPLNATVHYGENYDNAFWDGEQMVFGDGDGEIFLDFTLPVDVIGHELTHGVTQYTANLEYFGQSGALNESVSDVFGSLVKQYSLGQSADQADWLIGAGLLGPSVTGRRAALDEGAGHGVRRRRPRQGPAARRRWTTTSAPVATTAASTSTPASPTTPSTWLADRARRQRVGAGGPDLVRRADRRRAVRRRAASPTSPGLTVAAARARFGEGDGAGGRAEGVVPGRASAVRN